MASLKQKPANISKLQNLLQLKEKLLIKRQTELSKEDPFNDPDRLNDNAAIDADAAEQFGHENIAAMKKEVEIALAQIKQALARIHIGKYGVCESCGEYIDSQRLVINPTTTFCVDCETKRDQESL